MKAIIFLVAAVIISTGALAQNTPKSSKSKTKAPAGPVKSSLLKEGNALWVVKPMQDNETLDNGVTVKPNGMVKTASGKILPLSDGDALSPDGKVVGLNKKFLTTAYVKQGKMWKATKLDKTITLADGTTVSPDGTIKKKDGTIVPIKNNEILDIDVAAAAAAQ